MRAGAACLLRDVPHPAVMIFVMRMSSSRNEKVRSTDWAHRPAATTIAAMLCFGMLALLLVSGCGGGDSPLHTPSQEHSAADPGSGDTSSSASSAGSGPSAAVVIRGCPDPEAMGQAVGFPVRKTDLGQGDCAYFPRGQENPGLSVQMVHPHNTFPDMTTLAEAKKHDRFGGGTAETESADVGGGHSTSFLEDTPEYGPETFRAGESIEGRSEAEAMQTCDYFVLGTDGYPASVQAEAQKGGVYSYEGKNKSRAEVCEWATAALDLAIKK